MNHRLFALLFACAFVTACQSLERSWYRCDQDRFSGFEYARECYRITGVYP